MRNIRYYRRFFWAFIHRFKFLLVGSLVLGVILFFFFSKLNFIFIPFAPTEKIGVVGQFSLNNLPDFIQEEISVGLTQIDDDGNVLPGIATQWRHEEDGRVWIFELGDYKWQDGSEVVASHINYNFSDATSEVLDKRTVKFTLQDPYSPFPAVVSQPLFKRGLVGVGEWKVSALSAIGRRFTQSLRLVNQDTHEAKIYRFYPTEDAARTAFKLGEVDRLVRIIDPRELAEWNNTTVEQETYQDQYIGIFMNTQDDLLSDKRLRQALAYAIDKQDFELTRAISPISSTSWAFNPQVKQYLYDPQRAKELISEVFSGRDSQVLTINFVTTPSLLFIADKVKDYWEAAGIEVHLQVVNAPPSDFQALLVIDQIPSDPDQYSRWHSTQTQTNITRYTNTQKESPRIDKLLEEGRIELNHESRKRIYLDFQRFLLEDLPVIPLFNPVGYMITRGS